MAFEKDLSIALEAARKAGDLIRRDYESAVAVADAPVTVCTETDRGAQEIILRHLHAVLPGDALCAEEATETLANAKRAGPRIWIVDPIDGTRGFVMKNGEFSVMIGLIADGELAVGVVFEPALDRLTYATRGSGCWTSTKGSALKACRVSTIANLNEAALIQSHSKSPAQPSAPVLSIRPKRVLEMYSAGVKMACVARGEGELYVNTYSRFHDWDICAGHLIVTEAGGNVTTLRGEAIQYCQPSHSQLGGLLATNGYVHDAAVEKLEGVSS